MRVTQVIFSKLRQDVPDSSFYKNILSSFPGGMNLVFSYGSGVFTQNPSEPVSTKMIDFVFVVSDPKEWHRKNLHMNKNHYSVLMRAAGLTRILSLMENYGAAAYFNTGVQMLGRTIKYGTISEDNLLKDLTTWNTMYFAGRLHKPVNILTHDFEKSPKLLESLKKNLISAVLTSLLLLPESFTERDLFLTITGLSYCGDFRMTFGEDKHKISKIVDSNITKFRQLYYPVLDGICETSFQESSNMPSFIHWRKQKRLFDQDKTPSILHNHLKRLPMKLQLHVCRIFDVQAKHIRDVEEILKSVARYPDCSEIIQQAVANIVQASSKPQSLKGILTAGPMTTVSYSASKVNKMMKSLVPSNIKKDKNS